MTYREGLPLIKLHDPLTRWSRKITRQIKNISTTAMPIVTKRGGMVTYNEELQLIKSHDPSIIWPHEVTWQIKYIKSPLVEDLWAPNYAKWFKDTHRRKAPTNKTPALTKSMNMDIRIVGTLNQLFIRDSYTEIKFSKKIKELVGKLRFLWKVNFILPILFFLTLVFDSAVLYGNVAFSIDILSNESRHSSFFKKGLLFQKT